VHLQEVGSVKVALKADECSHHPHPEKEPSILSFFCCELSFARQRLSSD